MQHQKDDSKFSDQDQRDPEHELRLLCFVSDQQHGQIHRGCTTERGYQQQGILFDTPVTFDGGVLIVDRHNNGDDTDNDQVNIKILQNNLGVIKCS